MKYIRTDYHIFKVSRVLKDGTYLIKGKYHIEKGVCPEADTIEELCDEFVVKHKSNEKPYIADGYQKHKILEDRQKVFEYGVEIIYGAIWTDKGLIYAAKMNEKGELELI